VEPNRLQKFQLHCGSWEYNSTVKWATPDGEFSY